MPGIRETVAAHARVVGISNLIAGAAVRGPADRLLADLGIEASCVGVARGYRDLCAAFVIDEQDAARADEVEALGVRAIVTDTLMNDADVAAARSRAKRSPQSPERRPCPRSSRPAARSARSCPSRCRRQCSTRSCRRRASRPRPTTHVRGAGSSSTRPTPDSDSPTAWESAGAATSKATAWRRPRIDELVAASHAGRSSSAPSLVLGCLTWDGLDRYPDETRQRAEWGMALLSLGAAVENLMLATADAGYASCWVAAPIFCPEEARDALALPDDLAPPRDGPARAGPIPPTSAVSAPPVPPRRAPRVAVAMCV